jgi:hypothetical protein
MRDGAVVFVAIGLGLGLIMGGRWVRMIAARNTWRASRGAIPKAKAARKAAFGGYISHSRQAFIMMLLIVAVFFVLMKIAQSG